MKCGPPDLKTCQVIPWKDGKPGKVDPRYAAHKARCHYLGRYEPWEEYEARVLQRDARTAERMKRERVAAKINAKALALRGAGE